MRHCLSLTGLLLLVPAAAHAQVTINLRALDALPNAPPAITRPEPVPIPRPVPRPAPEARTASTGAPPVPPRPASPVLPTPPTPPTFPKPPVATPPAAPPAPVAAATPPAAPAPAPPSAEAVAPAAPAPPPATLPTAPPAAVALAPIPAPLPSTTAAPPPAPPVSASSGTTAAPDAGGLQLVFKPAESELSPDASAAIKRLVQGTPTGDTISYNVVAYASGQADDPSVARRASLSRGLAVRSALIADGVSSTRIYVRALGSGGGGPPDRVDITVLGLSGAAVGARP